MLSALLFAIVALVGHSNAAATPPKAIIWMLGDDYGYANVGFPHGPNPGNPEARTPTMDALVKEGVLLERHCTSDNQRQLTSDCYAGHLNRSPCG